jgi:dihydroneopterin aldolase
MGSGLCQPPLYPVNTIIIHELELPVQVGVPDAERARPQRLLVSVEMDIDFTAAVASDNLSQTVDYHAVVEYLRRLPAGRQWKLIETLAAEIADTLLREYSLKAVSVEIKKFIYADTAHVGVRVKRAADAKA